jgi:prophage DNA circulation protein
LGSIRDIHNAWRDALLPASFRGAEFHVEAGGFENGRRIVVHEFPKKELPYSEDMGRRAIEFTVRGYCIAYPHDEPAPLYRRDYRIPRDLLLAELEREGDGVLQLPTLLPMRVVCPRYRLMEEEKLGGYCVFDMAFVEFGVPPFKPIESSRENLIKQSEALRQRVLQQMSREGRAASEAAGAGGITLP